MKRFIGTTVLLAGIAIEVYGLSFVSSLRDRFASDPGTAGLALMAGSLLCSSGTAMVISPRRRKGSV